MALFGYKYSDNPLEQKSFEELSYADQAYIIANDEVAEPIVTKVEAIKNEAVSSAKLALLVLACGTAYYFYKGGK